MTHRCCIDCGAKFDGPLNCPWCGAPAEPLPDDGMVWALVDTGRGDGPRWRKVRRDREPDQK